MFPSNQFYVQERVNTTQPLCLTFTTTDVGYLCQSPENTVKHGVLAAKLADLYNIVGESLDS